MNDSNQNQNSEFKELGFYLNIGLNFVITLLMGVGAGWWLDKKLGWSPVFTFLGAFLGAGIGFYNLYRTLMGKKRK